MCARITVFALQNILLYTSSRRYDSRNLHLGNTTCFFFERRTVPVLVAMYATRIMPSLHGYVAVTRPLTRVLLGNVSSTMMTMSPITSGLTRRTCSRRCCSVDRCSHTQRVKSGLGSRAPDRRMTRTRMLADDYSPCIRLQVVGSRTPLPSDISRAA
ncbi:hypothetical protein EVAR_33692_1 [Eumeta japonica]|uniref:Uncharacterized protein n=1 Tax=Eumeta variegata TaxID=151549 RepID=A0A4C1VM22_EUMVA|nr:hypothetical protein EVAR_33692_1 [Eumeta japonica]